MDTRVGRHRSPLQPGTRCGAVASDQRCYSWTSLAQRCKCTRYKSPIWQKLNHLQSEWGYVLAGSARVAALDESGRNQIDTVKAGDIWYFPKGSPHTIQCLYQKRVGADSPANMNSHYRRERVFASIRQRYVPFLPWIISCTDIGYRGLWCYWVGPDRTFCIKAPVKRAKNRKTFQVDDWLAHTPKSVVAKNFGVNESVFDVVPKTDPYILPPTTVSTGTVDDPNGKLEGNSSFIYKLSDLPPQSVPGGGGTLAVIDSRNFPVAKTIAGTVVKLEPGGLRELHWHPNVSHVASRPTFAFLSLTRPGRWMALFPKRPRARNCLHRPSHRPNIWLLCRRYRHLPWQFWYIPPLSPSSTHSRTDG